MTFNLDTHWVWDFWLADDGDLFHLYYLHAARSLGDPHLRHRNARIGHATSIDLITWDDHGTVLEPGQPGDFDGSATWTGSVVRGPDGLWRMFYTGSRFLRADAHTNVETVGVAISPDLHTWTKAPGPIARADARWYEMLGDATWPEEAWRDPWVFADPAGDGWHMLVTARARTGKGRDRGVIGHAVSADLATWEVRPPLSAPDSGFAHIEVPQIACIEGRNVLLFSCDSPALAGSRTGLRGGIWAVGIDGPTGPYPIDRAELLAGESLYSGRVVQDRAGAWVLLAFENTTSDGEFVGTLSDPIAVTWTDDGAALRRVTEVTP